MKCPVCADVRMREVEKDGILIDICPDCKGVWLDRGELDKLMQGVREYQAEEARYDSQPSSPPFGANGQAGYNQAPGQPYNNSNGYGQQPYSPPPGYGAPQQGGYDRHYNGGYDSKLKYDKYGRPYKKKKTVLDVFGDLFE